MVLRIIWVSIHSLEFLLPKNDIFLGFSHEAGEGYRIDLQLHFK